MFPKNAAILLLNSNSRNKFFKKSSCENISAAFHTPPDDPVAHLAHGFPCKNYPSPSSFNVQKWSIKNSPPTFENFQFRTDFENDSYETPIFFLSSRKYRLVPERRSRNENGLDFMPNRRSGHRRSVGETLIRYRSGTKCPFVTHRQNVQPRKLFILILETSKNSKGRTGD